MRSVRLEPDVEDILDEARRTWDRLDDAIEMIEWVLARDPTTGDPVNEGGSLRTLVFEGAYAQDLPSIQLTYVDEAPYVTIKSIRVYAPQHAGGRA